MAVEIYNKVLPVRRLLYGDDHLQTADTIHNMAISYQALAHYERAMFLFKQALALYELWNRPPRKTANALKNIAITYSQQGDHKNAVNFFCQALSIEILEFGLDHLSTANTLNNLGAAYGRVGKFDEGISRCEKALEITVKYQGLCHVDVAAVHHNLGMMKLSQGFAREAKVHFRESYQIFVASLGANHPKSCRGRKFLRTVRKLASRAKSGRLRTRIIR